VWWELGVAVAVVGENGVQILATIRLERVRDDHVADENGVNFLEKM
jgi:hypothetical protein